MVSEVLEEGRRVIVTTEEGERIGFALNRATATFTAEQGPGGPRLIFGPAPGPELDLGPRLRPHSG